MRLSGRVSNGVLPINQFEKKKKKRSRFPLQRVHAATKGSLAVTIDICAGPHTLTVKMIQVVEL